MAPMPEPQLRRAIETLGCEFFLLFGQTEMSPTTTLFRPEHQLTHAGAVGTPTVSVRVASWARRELVGPGEQGEIVYRSPQALTGYLHDEAATEAAFAGGWFHSGDIGRFDDDGVLWFADRSRRHQDRGRTSPPSRWKGALRRRPADRRGGRRRAAARALDRGDHGRRRPRGRRGHRRGRAAAAVRAHLDPYKVPKAVVVLTDLPRTSTGKVQKNVLRQRLADHYSDHDAGGTA